MNRYSPHYNHDEQRTEMSIDEKGSWVHVTYVEELKAELAKHQESQFHPDWSLLEATREAMREYRNTNEALKKSLLSAQKEIDILKARVENTTAACSEHKREREKENRETSKLLQAALDKCRDLEAALTKTQNEWGAACSEAVSLFQPEGHPTPAPGTLLLVLQARAAKKMLEDISADRKQLVEDLLATETQVSDLRRTLTLQSKGIDKLLEENKGRDEARKWLEGICEEFERTVAYADWRAAGSKGMSVPFHGDFASVVQLPGAISRMRWWAEHFRKVLGP